MSKKVLIVGGSGLIGSHLSKYLSKKVSIEILDRNKSDKFKTNIMDVCDKNEVESFFEENNYDEGFDFNQDFFYENEESNIKSPGWIRYQKKLK